MPMPLAPESSTGHRFPDQQSGGTGRQCSMVRAAMRPTPNLNGPNHLGSRALAITRAYREAEEQ